MDEPRRRMERKSGSSSRSPSLSRRPSLKDKKGTTISKGKGKKSSSSGGKKERWLLTRKTWRYMSDAVGNLLPESHRSSSGGGGTTDGGTRRASSGGEQVRGGLGRSPSFQSPPPPIASSSSHSQQQMPAYHHHHDHQHSSDIPGASALPSTSEACRPKSMPTAIPQTSDGTKSGGGSAPGSKASSGVTSPTYGGIMSFPSHRPGVTPTGPGPGKSSLSSPPTSPSSLQPVEKFYPPSDDIPTLEKHFEAVCNKEKKFLLWSRTKPKGLSGPALRELKLKQKPKKGQHSGSTGHRDSSGSIMEALQMKFGGGDAYSKKENIEDVDFWKEADDDYDDYDVPDEITVRERRKSSTASSTASMMGAGGLTHGSLTFFRPLSTHSSHGSESCYSMILSPNGVAKICRNTGTQTDPFPEELLIRFRLQAVQEERQQQNSGEWGGVPIASASRQLSPDNQSDTTGGGGMVSETESPISPVRLVPSTFDSQKVSSPPPTTSASPMSPTTSTDAGRMSGGSERESQEKLLDTGSDQTSGRPSITGQESVSTTATKNGGGGTEALSSSATSTDKKSEESGYSSSISDTVMRYLRMVRKNSKADNKDTIDKFKTVNYDRSLRYIKSKNVTVEEAMAHEQNKLTQAKLDKEKKEAEATAEAIPAPATESSMEKGERGGKTVTQGAQQTSPNESEISPTATPTVTGGNLMVHTDVPSSLLPHLTSGTSSEAPLQLGQATSSTVGVQAGESLVRFLRNLIPVRKMSDFSSSYCSSDSPAEVFSPRYSFATTVMSSDTEGYGGMQSAAMASMMAAKGIHHSHYSNPHTQQFESGGIHAGGAAPPTPIDVLSSSTDPTTEYERFQAHQQQQLHQFTQKHQQLPHQPTGGPLSSSWTSSTTRSTTSSTTIKKSSSVQQMVSFGTDVGGGVGSGRGMAQPSAANNPTSSSYSLSQLFHYSPSKSLRSSVRHHHTETSGESGSPGTTSTPATPTTSSMGGSSSGGLMKSFFGSSPFSSSFVLGIKKGTLRKPTSTTSLTITTNTGSDSVSGRRGLNAPPPTTSSSPNLLSLIQSSAASAGSGFSNLFSSSRGSGGAGGSSSVTFTSRGGEQLGGGYHQTRGGGAITSTASSSGELRAQTGGDSFSSSFSLPINVSSGITGTRQCEHEPLSASSSFLLTSQLPKFKKSHDDAVTRYSKCGQEHPPSPHHHHAPTTHDGSMMMTKPKDLSELWTHDNVTSATNTACFSTPTGAQTDLYLTSGVMQKSKSSSSVLPLYGSSGSISGAGPGSSTAHLRASPSGSVERGGDHPTHGAGEGGGGGGGAVAAVSSSNRLISKSSKLFKSRSKSSTRATTSSSGSVICTWSPQGRCKWKSVTGKVVTLDPTNILSLSDVERLTLQDVALEKLRALNLGVDVKIPKEKVGGGQQKPKRRPYLLKKKALSTGFFESGNKREDTKESAGGGGSGLVFGISLSQCVENDRLRQLKTAATSSSSPVSADWEQPHKQSQNGGRNSVSSIFEMPKEDKDQLQLPQTSVPAIVSACISHLETYGLHTTGIFRVSTSLKRIRQLREYIDSGKEVQLGEDHSPHDVAALLKEFLRDLPEPLLCRDLYQAFLKTQKIRNRKLQLEAIQHLVQLLPVSNRDTLASLLKFFAKVVANACETRSKTGELLPGNKMEGYSLATLIAPNILPCMPTEGAVAASMDQNAALTKERRESIDLVNYMISNFSAIFDVSAELLHDVYLHLMDTNPDAIEGILKQRSGTADDVNDELETTSSVFEESESGELLEPEETVTKVYRKREDILHEGAGKGGSYPEHYREDRTRERSRIRRDESKERLMMGGNTGATHSADVDKQHSGGESDSSSTRSTSRWFRRSRGDAKGRTSSDSGSEKVKGNRKRDISLFESKRASSLDSVNVQEPGGGGGTTAVRGSPRTTVIDMIPSRPLSGSEQSLRVPEHLNRRQSSPVLESSGVITASLKIPVPVPLNIDDSDIPYIEDEHLEGATHLLHHHHQYLHHHTKYPQQHSHHHHVVHHHDICKGMEASQYAGATHLPSSSSSMSVARCRSMSTDSSMPLITTSSSINTTPISSPARQPSSEVSSPTGFSPPTSPLLYGTFPVEEMTARMLIGSTPPVTSSTPSTVSASSSPSIHQFHHHYQQTPTLGAVTTTPSPHHYPAMFNKESGESKSGGSTPTTRPKIDKPTNTTPPSSTTTFKKSSGVIASSSGMSSPHSVHKSTSYGANNTPQIAIASLGMGLDTPKYGDIGTKSAPPSPQPPSSLNTLSNAPSSTSPVASTSSSTPSSATILAPGEPKGLGKETKGANIGGLIKSKTADFEKLTKVPTTEAELFSGAQPTQIYSIAPKMRLRSQENVLLKQQFLLRQQQHHQGERQKDASGSGSGRGGTGATSSLKSEQHPEQGESSSQSGAGAGGPIVCSSPTGRSITRRRLVGSSSTSAIVSANKPGGGGSGGSSSSSSTHRARPIAMTKEPEAGPSASTTGLEANKEPVPISGSSPSRWKRSEIIASRQQSQSTNDPETFV